MNLTGEHRIPWREREFLSLANAGLVVDRSRSWVEDKIREGALDARRLTPGGPLVVTVASLRRIVDGAEPAEVPAIVTAPPQRLALIVDNS